MLREVRNVRQIEGEPSRRWFGDEFFDLIVWYDKYKAIIGFQLCYDLHHDERALTWIKGRGYNHNRIDDGESLAGGYKATPILVKDGAFEHDRIASLFGEASRELDHEVAELVMEKINGCW